jgi:aspartyl/asparaginyl-tRNA synthetase
MSRRFEISGRSFIEEEKSKPQAERSEMALLEKLNFVLENNFKRVSYTEAIEILRDSTPNKKKNSNISLTNGVLIYNQNTNVTWLKNTLNVR